MGIESIHASGAQRSALADQFGKQCVRLPVLDEIHHYPDFERALKSIHAALDLQMVFGGSWALHLVYSKAGLSRRAVMYAYAMSGLSFREYLELQAGDIFALAIDLDIPPLFKVERDELASLKKLLAALPLGAELDQYQQVIGSARKPPAGRAERNSAATVPVVRALSRSARRRARLHRGCASGPFACAYRGPSARSRRG